MNEIININEEKLEYLKHFSKKYNKSLDMIIDEAIDLYIESLIDKEDYDDAVKIMESNPKLISFEEMKEKYNLQDSKKPSKSETEQLTKLEKEILEGINQALQYAKGDKSVGTKYTFEVPENSKQNKQKKNKKK